MDEAVPGGISCSQKELCLDNFLLQRLQHRLRLTVHLQLFIDMPDVRPYRVNADKMLIGDELVGVAFHEAFQDVQFTGREVVIFLWLVGSRLLLEKLQYPAGDAGRHGRAAPLYIVDGGDDFGGGGAFEQVARCAVADGLENFVLVLEDSEHEHLRFRAQCFHDGRRLDARPAWHVNVHEDNVGPEAWHLHFEVAGIGKCADEFEGGRGL